jgi:hypothetical protein
VYKPPQKELHSLYCSPDIAWVIKSRRLRWAVHAARMEGSRSGLGVGLDGRTILERILKK